MKCTNCGAEASSLHQRDYVLANVSENTAMRMYTGVEPIRVAVCDRCLAEAAWMGTKVGLRFVG
jgi:hypothetical protein